MSARPARDALLAAMGDLIREVHRLRGEDEQPPYRASAAAAELVHNALVEASERGHEREEVDRVVAAAHGARGVA